MWDFCQKPTESACLFITALLLVGLISTKFHVTDAAAIWLPATATFYGGPNGSGTMGKWLWIKTAALSTALFNDGASCGGCYQIVCDAQKAPQWCQEAKYITATNFCPPNYALPSDDSGWCNPNRQHFDMSKPEFETIAIYRAGIVPILYMKVRCRSCGIRFTVNGRDYFELVLVSNVGGTRDISMVWIKGSKTNKWETMSRNWGANWQSFNYLNGQSLSFRVQVSNGRIRTALNVVPSNWQFGQSFKSNVQF
ncbi:putative expansin-A17 [Hibiscus syriacus]|uniref:Expansin n=1 Tax=Hibiscus syriacus TaxID=106335 RepID=A0A6A3CEB7_HIBSY|nr:putative expansin-A17 [Hibiscus syriacus]